jgi:tyrosine-protein kinase Etk/Wzc
MSRKMTFKDSSGRTAENSVSAANHLENHPPTRYQFDVNIFELARLLVSRRRFIAVMTITVTVVAAAYLFLQPNLYTSTAVILPSGNTANLSALENLVGLAGNNAENYDENSSAMYPVILNSNLIVDSVAHSIYSFRDGEIRRIMTLADYFGIDNPDRLRRAVRDITSVSADQRTGEIYIGVETQYPEMSRAVVTNYLNRLEDFNLHKRRSQAGDNEKYLARQLMTAKQELQKAEDDLETFQKANLDWASSGSPEILKELGRLQREVDVKSATYAMLAREHEMAKLDVQKDIPIVRLLDPPSLPTMKSGPFRRNLILLAGIIAFMFAVMAVIILHFVRQLTSGPEKDDYDTLRDDVTQSFPRTHRVVSRIRATLVEHMPLQRK